MNFETHLENIKKTDPEMYKWITKEIERQESTLELIPSECAASVSVMEALGSVLTNKYSEGYPGKRYYGGNEFIDEVEELTRQRAKKLFGVPHANVQPYSGSPANFAVYNAVCEPGDNIMGHSLLDGGHLTHGFMASATSKYFNSMQYGVESDGTFDFEKIRTMALAHKPKLIWVGASAYPRIINFEEFAKIADEVGAYLVADIAHIAGLVIAGVHPSPVPFVHIVTSTTHKTLGGPRGGIILVTQKGLEKDGELAKKIDQSIFPGLQGGPHNHQIAAIGVALKEAETPEFKERMEQIVKNVQVLADELIKYDFDLVSGGSDNHLILMDCGKGRGVFMQDALDMAGITLNKNTIPQDPSSPFYPSGIRFGTPIMTTRNMKEPEMIKVAKWFKEVADVVADFQMPEDKLDRQKVMKEFSEFIKKNDVLKKIRKEVAEVCDEFPLYK